MSMSEIRVSDTLSVDVHTNGSDLHVTVERHDGGLVRVEVDELAGLVQVLRSAAGVLSVALERGERRAAGTR